MRYDVVIANPPYGKIGNEITKAVVDNIDYGVFVNLLPANDYRRWNRESKLYQFVDIRSMRPVVGAFKDAAVTTMMCKVNKERALYISEDEFEIENYSDKSLKKFFYGNVKRKHEGIDNSVAGMLAKDFEKVEVSKSIYLGGREMHNKHLPYDIESMTNRYNMGKAVKEELIEASKARIEGYGRMGHFYIIPFDTELEKKNIVDFMYSKDGFRFMSKLFTALNVDNAIAVGKWFPKVDWTRPQTVQTILADYGYTPSEIEEVVADLANFKGMEE